MVPFLMTLLVIIAIALVGVILMQKSEGGVLGIGGGSKFGGMMTGAGAGDFLSKSTTVLATAFFVLCFILSLVVYKQNKAKMADQTINVEQVDGQGGSVETKTVPDGNKQKPTVPLTK